MKPGGNINRTRTSGRLTAMSTSLLFDRMLTKAERRLLRGLDSPPRIQAFLDEAAYSTDKTYRCPLRVLRERRAHCFDGAVFGAAALSRIGHPPLIVDMFSNGRDDEHLLAVYKVDGHWGAVAKSNFVGLRFREPVYRGVRELVMSYFEQYYNTAGEKTLRAYTRPLNLNTFYRQEWMAQNEAMDLIAARTDELQRIPLITRKMAARLSPVDQRSYQSGLAGSDPQGLFKP
jgi:hypothetical protein